MLVQLQGHELRIEVKQDKVLLLKVRMKMANTNERTLVHGYSTSCFLQHQLQQLTPKMLFWVCSWSRARQRSLAQSCPWGSSSR